MFPSCHGGRCNGIHLYVEDIRSTGREYKYTQANLEFWTAVITQCVISGILCHPKLTLPKLHYFSDNVRNQLVLCVPLANWLHLRPQSHNAKTEHSSHAPMLTEIGPFEWSVKAMHIQTYCKNRKGFMLNSEKNCQCFKFSFILITTNASSQKSTQ